MPGFGQQFEVKRSTAFLGDGIDQSGKVCEVGVGCVFCAAAKAAVKIPVVHAFGQGFVPFPLYVFADFVLGCLQHTVTVLAFDV